ncbi:MAG: hypothetical protein HY821_22575 [Acidobacteria bacterium]|nr:hypothetical protein [Acidobacteriota bacterium]
MSRLVLISILLCPAFAQDPAAVPAPPSMSSIEAERRASEEKINSLQAQLEDQRRELDAQKASLAQLDLKLKEGRGYVTKDEFAAYQKALTAFQQSLTAQLRQQENIEREALHGRIRTEQAVFENAEAALSSLITNLSALSNTGNTTRALIQLPSPVAASAQYQAAVKALDTQSRKSSLPSLATQLMGAFPQVAWLNTAVTLVLSPSFRSKSKDTDAKTIICARDFADQVDTARKARIAELDALNDRLVKLRDRMSQNHQRMLALLKGSGPVKDRVAAYFGAMNTRDGEIPLQALTALDDRLRASRREVSTGRMLLTDYRQLMESIGEQQGRLQEFILMHQKYACAGVETFQQDVSKSLVSLEKARQQFKQMLADTDAQESIKVLDSTL